MKSKEEDNLKLIASIDTLSIRTPNNDLLLPDGAEDTGHSKDGITSLKVNPNKFAGYEVYSYSDYRDKMRSLLDGSGVEQFWYSRVDFRFDSYQPAGRYEALEKVNRALILCYYCQHPDAKQNLYETRHGWNRQRLSICYRANTVQLEYYNKEVQEKSGTVLSRLELRNTRLGQLKDTFPLDRPYYLAQVWKAQLADCISVYEQMQLEQNEILFQQYKDGIEKGIYNNAADFVQKNIEYIFTGKQLENLFKLMGAANPKNARYNFVTRHKDLAVHFIKPKDLSNYGRYKSYTDYYARIIQPAETEKGYLTVCLSRSNVRIKVRVHRPVAYYFLLPGMPEGTRFDGSDVHHKANKADNQAWNLEIVQDRALHRQLDKAKRAAEAARIAA